jgi:hypothetical protein
MTEADHRDVAVPEADRLWEGPGAVRRDCAPHRGNLLGALGTLSLTAGSWPRPSAPRPC